MIRAFQWDLARQTERLSWLMAQLPKYADWGYQELYLHLEDAVEFPSVPGVARADAYSYRQMERLVAAARKVGIGVVPIVNLLGHTQYLIKVPWLRQLNELVSPDGQPLERGQICPLHPQTLGVADQLIRDLAPFCTAGKIHVGLDESYHLGKHPRSRAEVEEVGLAAHFGRYVQRLNELVEKRALRMGLWADMLALLPEAVKFLPRGAIAYDWYYYPFQREPAVELHNFRPYDLAPALRRQGVEYWGCPMSGPFRFEPMPKFGDRLANLRSWWQRCERVAAGGFLVTSWEPSRVAAPVVQAVEAAAASLWLRPKARSNEAMLSDGFRRTMASGARQARAMAETALRADRYAYAGYFRWEIEEDWAYGAGRGDGRQLAKEAKFLAGLARRAKTANWPRAFAASLEFRAYLAERDHFVVNGLSHGVLPKLDFKSALRAARDMWRSTRSNSKGPNELAIEREQRRWSATSASVHKPYGSCRHGWSATSGRAGSYRVLARTTTMPSAPGGRAPPTPAVAQLGRADTARLALSFKVHNVAPALQKVVVEMQDGGGVWRDVRSRFTIEFTAAGARRRAPGLVRPFVAQLSRLGALRIAVRGVGLVEVSDLVVSSADRQVSLLKKGRRIRLGAAAPRGGFPPLDWSANLGKTYLIPAEALQSALLRQT